MNKKLVINTDGGSRGNPGDAGIGVIIKSESGDMIYQYGEYIGKATNNVAEYKALIKSLLEAKHLGATELKIQMDSELIVKQMQGVYKIKEPTLQGLAKEAMMLLKNFKSYNFVHVRREFNKEADSMVNQAIDAAL